jgi:hypothetical protein
VRVGEPTHARLLLRFRPSRKLFRAILPPFLLVPPSHPVRPSPDSPPQLQSTPHTTLPPALPSSLLLTPPKQLPACLSPGTREPFLRPRVRRGPSLPILPPSLPPSARCFPFPSGHFLPSQPSMAFAFLSIYTRKAFVFLSIFATEGRVPFLPDARGCDGNPLLPPSLCPPIHSISPLLSFSSSLRIFSSFPPPSIPFP